MTKELTRAEWLEKRKNSIGASEAAAIVCHRVGEHSFQTEFELYTHKVDGGKQDETRAMRFGSHNEDFITGEYERETGRVPVDIGATNIQYHKDYPYISATLDRVIEGNEDNPAPADGKGILEIKAVGGRFENPDEWIENIPFKYRLQTQLQMACYDVKWGAICAMFPGDRYKIVYADFLRNDEFLETIYPFLTTFWQRVLDKNPPKITNAGDLYIVKRFYPVETGETIELSEVIGDVVTRWDAAKAEVKHHTGEAKMLEALIRAEMQDNTFGTLPDGSGLSLKVTKRKGYTRVVEASEFRTLRKVKGK